jgi:hypothetical protein
MAETTKTARFTRGAEFTYQFADSPLLGPLIVTGVVDEVAEDWIGFRYHNENEIRIFGDHPQSVGALADLKPVRP